MYMQCQIQSADRPASFWPTSQYACWCNCLPTSFAVRRTQNSHTY